MHSVKADYYELLGVARDASETEIKRAYRKLAREHHPDVRQGDSQSEELFKQISEAYAVLSDPERRSQYDRYGHSGPQDFGQASSPFDIFDIFASAFGGDPFGFGGRGARVATGQSLRYEVQIGLQDVLNGVEKQVKYTRLAVCETCDGTGAAPGTQPRTCGTCGGVGQVRAAHSTFIGTISTVQDCPHCRGTGQIIDTPCEDCGGRGVQERPETLTVTIPAGVDDGDELVLRGYGSAPPGGGMAGDLYVRIRVADDPRFVRRGADLHAELELTMVQAALGDTVTVPTLEDEEQVEVPAGTQTGEQTVLPGRGLPKSRSRGRGDLTLHMRVVTPTHLTPRQKELLAEFAAERGEHSNGRDKGFFERIKDAISGE